MEESGVFKIKDDDDQGCNHWGVGGRTPNIFIDPQFWTAIYMGVGLALLHCNKVDYFKIYLSTIHQIERFEVKNFRGLTKPLPQTSLPLFLWLRPRFGLCPQISAASRPWFGLYPILTPPTFEAWLGPWWWCHILIKHAINSRCTLDSEGAISGY